MTRIDVKAEYERIGRERYEAGRATRREALWLCVRTLTWCWFWSLAGIALILASAHVHAAVGWIYPRRMFVAQAYFWGGLFVGAGGIFATLIINWRRAMERGLID